MRYPNGTARYDILSRFHTGTHNIRLTKQCPLYPAEQGFVPENVFLERLPEIAKNAIADACTGSNPRQPTQEEMEKLLKCCYYDTEVDF